MKPRVDIAIFWSARVLSLAGLVITAWIGVTAWPMLIHGQPVYAVLVGATFLFALVFVVRSWRRGATVKSRWRILRSLSVIASAGWIALIAWLCPSVAVEPALAAMSGSASVTVTEDATQIVLRPTGVLSPTGVFFQPGARVDARAYAAVLEQLAQAGHLVVIPKQPLGIAFLSLADFSSSRSAFPGLTNWVVGGHSLGGTVAAIDAEKYCGSSSEPVVGLLLFASYPATNMSGLSCPVLSISGSADGLATPEKVAASKPTLPVSTTYVEVNGGIHAFFGDYGSQAGDGIPAISHDSARALISSAAAEFVNAASATRR